MATNYFDKKYIGIKIGNFEIVKITKSLFSRAAMWDCKCLNCNAITTIMASYAVTGVGLVCECGNSPSSKPSYDSDEVPYNYGVITKYDREKLRKLRNILIARCYNRENKSYYLYGGMGVTVDNDWIMSLDNFIKWATENGYKPWLELKRYNESGNYCPDNCYWALIGTAAKTKDNTEKMDIYNIELICNTYEIDKEKLLLAIENNKELLSKIAELLRDKTIDNKKYIKAIKKNMKYLNSIQSNIFEVLTELQVYGLLKNGIKQPELDYISEKLNIANKLIGDAIDKLNHTREA